MPRTCDNTAIHTLTGRKALSPRAAPYWRAVRMGLRVGYRRKPADAAGTWLARLALPANKIAEKVLGGADDAPARADGEKILSYAQAVDRAQAWAAGAGAASGSKAGDTRAAITVRAALLTYRDTKAEAQPLRAGEVRTLIRRHLPDDLSARRVSSLTPVLLREWLTGRKGPKGEQLSQDRLDGLAGIMGAALRATRVLPPHVITEGLGAEAVGAARGARSEGAARNVVLTSAQAGAALRAATEESEDFGIFVALLEASGLRPVQIAGCRVEDFDPTAAMLTVPRSAKGKPGVAKAGACHVPLPTALVARIAAYIAALRADRRGLLFIRPEKVQATDQFATWQATGRRVPWDKMAWGRAWNRTVSRCIAAGTPMPDDATIYSLRHTRATGLIDAGLSLREVAARLDTSAVMLERTYSRHIAKRDAAQDRVRAILENEAAARAKAAAAAP